MFWELFKNKKKVYGQDNFIIKVYDEEWKPNINLSTKTETMSFSIYEVLESLPRDFIRQYLNYLNEEEPQVSPNGKYRSE